jgi:hypothetical protein
VCIFLRLFAKRNYRFLAQRINIKFYVKLSLEMTYCALNMIPKAKTIFLIEAVDILTTQEGSNIEITKEDNVHHFLRYTGCCSL